MLVMTTHNSHKHFGLDDILVREVERMRTVCREREDLSNVITNIH
jgi:hypothetical protein